MPLPQLPYHLVNVFTSTPHAGSQAAVILLDATDPRASDEEYKVNVSRDFNLPATVFLTPLPDAKYTISGTQARELPLCGHGTLAASWVVFNVLQPTATTATFVHPVRGELGAVLEGERGQGARIGFSLPISPAVEDEALRRELVGPITRATGLKSEEILKVAKYEYGSRSVVVQIPGEVDLKALKIVPRLLGEHNAVTIITQLTGLADDGAVMVNSRVFIPVIGLDEDTSTGSAHSVLTGYYLSPTGAGRRSTATFLPAGADVSSATLNARQLSPRGGGMRCAYRDGRAWLVGQAWRTGEGRLEVFE